MPTLDAMCASQRLFERARSSDIVGKHLSVRDACQLHELLLQVLSGSSGGDDDDGDGYDEDDNTDASQLGDEVDDASGRQTSVWTPPRVKRLLTKQNITSTVFPVLAAVLDAHAKEYTCAAHVDSLSCSVASVEARGCSFPLPCSLVKPALVSHVWVRLLPAAGVVGGGDVSTLPDPNDFGLEPDALGSAVALHRLVLSLFHGANPTAGLITGLEPRELVGLSKLNEYATIAAAAAVCCCRCCVALLVVLSCS